MSDDCILPKGYPSLFKYCTDVLYLSEHAAYNRIEAAGRVNLFAVRRLAPHLTAENHRDVLTLARHRSKGEIEELVARLRPLPPVPDVVRKLPTRAQAVGASAALQVTSQNATGKPQDGEALEIAAPLPDIAAQHAAVAPARARRSVISPLALECYKVQFTASATLHAKLREAQALLRHQIPNGDLEKVFDRALEALLAHLRRQTLAATERPRQSRSLGADPATCTATSSVLSSRHIPAAVKRAVWERDGERCAFVSVNGQRCAEDGFLEFHHVVPYALGGRSTADNIELRCRARNGFEAERKFGQWATAVREDDGVFAQAVAVSAITVPRGRPQLVPARVCFEPGTCDSGARRAQVRA